MVGLYPSITHEVGLRALREALNKRDDKTIPTEKLLKMPDFVLKTIISNLAINQNNKYLKLPYACIFINDLGNKFLEG